MRIVIITVGVLPMPPVKGGAVENLIEHYVQQNEENKLHDFIIYSRYDSMAEVKSKKYKNTHFKYINSNKLLFRAFRAIRYMLRRYLKLNVSNQFINEVIKDLKKRNFDLVIIENKPEYAIPLEGVAKGKIVQHIHNDYLSLPSKKNKEILDASDKVLVVSDYVRHTLSWYHDSNKIKTLYNGIDIEKFSKGNWYHDSLEYRKKMGISKKDVVILYSGRITEQKGVKDLVKAFKILQSSNAKLLVVGASWYSSKNEDKFTKELKSIAYDLNERILFTGYVDYDFMPIIYASSDIAVMPSIATEAAGLVTIEARAMGLPLIVSDSGGIPEYINESCAFIIKRGTNFIEELSNCLDELIFDEKLRNKMGENALREINKFSKQYYYQKMMKALKS